MRWGFLCHLHYRSTSRLDELAFHDRAVVSLAGHREIRLLTSFFPFRWVKVGHARERCGRDMCECRLFDPDRLCADRHWSDTHIRSVGQGLPISPCPVRLNRPGQRSGLSGLSSLSGCSFPRPFIGVIFLPIFRDFHHFNAAFAQQKLNTLRKVLVVQASGISDSRLRFAIG